MNFDQFFECCLFSHVPRIEGILRRFFTWCPIYTLVENVASMDPQDCKVMSEAYGMDPWLVDASGVSLARRPRLYWLNWKEDLHRFPLSI